MQINSINSIKNIYNIQNINAAFNSSRSNSLSFKGDTFEKSSVNKATEPNKASLEGVWNEARIQKLYDEVYEDTLDLISLTKDLNMEKPKIKTVYKNRGYAQASYSFQSNTLKFFMPKIKEDYFIAIVKDGSGEELGDYHILSESAIQEQKEGILRRHPGAKILAAKLTDKEKEAYIKTLTSHELRHWVQTHLAASTKDCSKIFKNAQLKNFEYLKDDDENYSGVEYLDNFVPKKIIQEDKKLKYSLIQKDARYLSTKRHIVDYSLQLIKRPFDEELYKASPMEADAIHYAFEYFQLLLNKPEYSHLRKTFIDTISIDLYSQAEDGLQLMKEAGFPGLYAKIR